MPCWRQAAAARPDQMPSTRRPIVTPQLVIGFGVMALGVLFLLSNIGYTDIRAYVKYWPVILILIGLSHWVQARHGAQVFGGACWLFVGVWLLGNNLGLIQLRFWEAVGMFFWPLLLVMVGGSIVWRALRRDASKVERLESVRHIRTMALMGGFKRRVNAAEFEGGEMSAIMGGIELDLTSSTMAPHGETPGILSSLVTSQAKRQAVVDVFAFWGGIVIRVPQGWALDVQVSPILGGVEDKTVPTSDPNAPCLIIRGTLVMGGVEVKH